MKTKLKEAEVYAITGRWGCPYCDVDTGHFALIDADNKDVPEKIHIKCHGCKKEFYGSFLNIVPDKYVTFGEIEVLGKRSKKWWEKWKVDYNSVPNNVFAWRSKRGEV